MPGMTLKSLMAGLFWLAPAALAQVAVDVRPRIPAARPAASLRVDTNLVLVPVSVCDAANRPVVGLEKEQFRVFDDKVEQTVTHFAMDDEPLAVGLVFDVSGSMGRKLKRSRRAAAEFFRTANPDDEFFLVTFSDRPTLAVPLTSDTDQIQNRLTFMGSRGSTALIDAIYLAVSELKKSTKSRKALLIISDGGDNNSRYTEGEVKSLVRESDLLIYSIGIFESSGGHTLEELGGPNLLREITEQTGGRAYAVDNLREMPDIAAKIGIQLRNRYVLGFSPMNPLRDGRYHRLRVQLVQSRGMPKLDAHWRLGYYAPGN